MASFPVESTAGGASLDDRLGFQYIGEDFLRQRTFIDNITDFVALGASGEKRTGLHLQFQFA